MAITYSDDLRRKLLEAHGEGEGSLPVLAARFRVSVGWAKKISSALLHTGQMERAAGKKRGRQSKVTPEVSKYLGSLVEAQPDLTLEKIQGFRAGDADPEHGDAAAAPFPRGSSQGSTCQGSQHRLASRD